MKRTLIICIISMFLGPAALASDNADSGGCWTLRRDCGFQAPSRLLAKDTADSTTKARRGQVLAKAGAAAGQYPVKKTAAKEPRQPKNCNSVKEIETRVVQVFATRKSNYYHKPWKSPNFVTNQASGFFFKDDKNFPGQSGLILTNAHAVSMAQSIYVSSGKEKRRYPVEILGSCDTADFAVIRMAPKVLERYEVRNGKLRPFELGDSDKLRLGDKVLGWGYPLGGERISKSEEGEINRIEVRRYAYSHDYWLMIQASLQQNRGNSGGPVLKDGKVVGLAFQGYSVSDRINYFIPINLVKSLIPVLKKKESIPGWRYVIQEMFDPLKEYFNMSADDGGVLLDYVIPDGGPDKFGLKAGDILMQIDAHSIDNFGDIFFEPLQQKIAFSEILKRKKVGDSLSLRIMRNGKSMKLEGKIAKGLPKLVPKIFTDANYFIFGGIGFVELTYNCVRNLGKSGVEYRKKFMSEYPEKAYQKIVIISEIFPEYGLIKTGPYRDRVLKINDKEVLNIRMLYDEIKNLKRKGTKRAMLEIDGKLKLPIDFAKADKLDAEIKKKYAILYMKTPGEFRE